MSSITTNQTRLDESIQVIKDIISQERSNIKLSAFKESFYIEELIGQIVDNYKSENTIIEIHGICSNTIIYGERNKLHQVITNIIVNAIEACIPNEKTYIDITLNECDDLCVISFQDHGIGIEDSFKNKIFKFKSTTKNRGSGLGLHSCMNIMNDLGGDLTFESKGENKGTTFTLSLPLPKKKHNKVAV